MAKVVDENGFRTYLDIPITTEGVFDYAGFQIDQTGKIGLDKNKVYKVYRPAEELLSDKFVKSLEEMPLTDDHTPLGDGGGLLPAEKNTHGVLFNVRKNDAGNGLVGDIKVFSESLKRKIDAGKREVSLGYTCLYRQDMGIFEGKPYDFVQYDLYANHCAIVDEARMGHACRVTDSSNVTCDSLELPTMPDDNKDKKSCADELIEKLKGCSDEDIAKVKDFLGCGEKPDEKENKEGDKAPDEKKEDKPEDVVKKDGESDDAAEKKDGDDKKDTNGEAKDAEDRKAAMDAAARNAIAEYQKAVALAERCKPFLGNISMDGIYTEKDMAVKICTMDSALKGTSPENAVSSVNLFVKMKEKDKGPVYRTVAVDSAEKGGYDFASAFKARK